ncbi:MAG: hypothetical protein ABI267_08840 [Ginsengibacter sp.]
MAEKQIKRLFWKLFKSHFGWPKILFFLLLATILFTLFSFKIFFVKWFLMVTLLLGSGIILYTPFLEGMISGAGKKFLLVSFLWVPSSIVFLPCLLYLQGLAGTKSFLTHIPPHILIPGISILLSFNLIAICVAWQTFNSIKKNLYQTYPEVFSTAK